MSTKHLSETRGEAQRDSTTFQEAASRATWGGIGGNLADQADLQNALRKAGNSAAAEIILPLGLYSSGTYTLPNGRTWADYERIEVITSGSTDIDYVGALAVADRDFMDAYPNAWNIRVITNSATSQDWAGINAINTTQFTAFKSNTDRVRSVKGYLREGVV